MIIDFQSSGGGGGGKVEIVLNATENGVYTPEEGYVYKKAVVNVPTYDPTFINLELLGFSGTTAPVFGESPNLTGIKLSESITRIPDNFLFRCYDVVGVIDIDGVTQIGHHAFNSTAISSITIPSSYTGTSLPMECFRYCRSLTAVTFECENLIGIGRGVFRDCTSLQSIVIPEGVTEISDTNEGAFETCTALTSVTLPSTLEILDCAFRGCSALTALDLPSGLTQIGNGAFNGTNITFLDIPSGVTSIGYDAFWFAEDDMTEIICRPVTPPTFAGGNRVFCKHLYVPDESVEAYKTANNWSRIADKILPISDYPSA